MLQVNQSSGDTVQFNMERAADRQRWERLSTDPAFQQTITGASILWGGRQYAAPRPQRFRSIHYEHRILRSRNGDRVTGEQVIVQADTTRTTMTVWRGQNGSMKVEVERAGRRVHNPGMAGLAQDASEQGTPARSPSTAPRHADGGKTVAQLRRTG